MNHQKANLLSTETTIPGINYWSPHFDGPSIKARQALEMNYSEIASMNREELKKGDDVLIYYWNKTNKKHPDIRGIVVEL